MEADYGAWKAYAQEKGIHPAILQFLELKKEYFYHIETTVKGRLYVTARGWEDLSEVIKLAEEEGGAVDETLVGQFLRNDAIVREFTAYYDLYNKYKKDYHIPEILNGQIAAPAVERAKAAAFDERLSLLGMLIDKVQGEIRENMELGDCLGELVAPLKALQGKDAAQVSALLEKYGQTKEKQLYSRERAGALSAAGKKKEKYILRFYGEANRELVKRPEEMPFAVVKQLFDERVAGMKEETSRIQERLHALFTFVEKAFEEGNEMLILVTELTAGTRSAEFIARFGCPDYQRHNEKLMLSERQVQMQKAIAELEI